jgi:hypothetical protein
MTTGDTKSYAGLAPNRDAIHTHHASQRILSKGSNDVGISGEFAFGEFCGVWPDTELKPGGDCGIDFRIKLGFTVDVKTARKPLHLLHERGKPFADIFVLAHYCDESKSSSLVGWHWGTVLAASPVKDFGMGVINHYIHASNLKKMEELRKRLVREVWELCEEQ